MTMQHRMMSPLFSTSWFLFGLTTVGVIRNLKSYQDSDHDDDDGWEIDSIRP